MAATTFYTGQAERVTVTHNDNTGTPIAHATIDDVRYLLVHENEDSLLKFRKTAPADWGVLTEETAAGQYTLEVQESDSKEWKSGKVFLEWFIKITNADFVDGYKPMGKEHLFNVIETNYATE